MIDRHFAIVAAVLTLAGAGGYALDTLRGQTQPNRVSWGMWALAPLIAFAAELSEHAGLQSLLTFAVGFGPLMVVAASLRDPRAYARLTRLDLACGALSLAALGMWAVTGKGDVAIAFSILSDLWAAIPTLHKALYRPETESAKAFVPSAVGCVITLLTIHPGAWVFANFGFPIYILLIDCVISALILTPRRHAATRG
jgi:hypothetical protein